MFDFSSPYHCYILGLLWGDGYCEKYNQKPGYYSGIRIETVYTDSIEYEHVLNLGNIKYCKSYRERANRKPQQRISLNNTSLDEFIRKYNFNQKSGISPDKLLFDIPDVNKNYWLRGYLDADGCIDSDNNYVIFSSTYEQDWAFMNNLAQLCNVSKFSIYKQESKLGHKSSKLQTTSITNSMNLLTYIYSGITFGLSRKIDKFKHFQQRVRLIDG